MIEIEKLLTQIGEFAYTEIDEVSRIEYVKEKDILNMFIIIMDSGKQYSLEIKEYI